MPRLSPLRVLAARQTTQLFHRHRCHHHFRTFLRSPQPHPLHIPSPPPLHFPHSIPRHSRLTAPASLPFDLSNPSSFRCFASPTLHVYLLSSSPCVDSRATPLPHCLTPLAIVPTAPPPSLRAMRPPTRAPSASDGTLVSCPALLYYTDSSISSCHPIPPTSCPPLLRVPFPFTIPGSLPTAPRFLLFCVLLYPLPCFTLVVGWPIVVY